MGAKLHIMYETAKEKPTKPAQKGQKQMFFINN